MGKGLGLHHASVCPYLADQRSVGTDLDHAEAHHQDLWYRNLKIVEKKGISLAQLHCARKYTCMLKVTLKRNNGC